jgi:hypothetical protein
MIYKNHLTKVAIKTESLSLQNTGHKFPYKE